MKAFSKRLSAARMFWSERRRLSSKSPKRCRQLHGDSTHAVLRAIAIVLILRVAWLTGLCDGFEYSGTLLIDGYRQVKGFPQSIGGVFTVRSSGCQWQVRSKRFDQLADYDEDCHDGTNVFSITCITSWVAQQKERGRIVGENVGEAVITPGATPENSTELNRILWLVFASGCYLRSNVTGQLPAIASHSARHAYLYGFRQKGEWALAKNSPHLPNSIVIYDSGRMSTWVDKDAGFTTGPPIEKPWRQPYDKGFTNAILERTDGAASGKDLPSYCFTVYGPKPDGTSNKDVALFRRYTLSVTNVSDFKGTGDFRPVIPGLLKITDQRFEKESPPLFQVLYDVRERWLTEKEVQEVARNTGVEQAQNVRKSASHAATLGTAANSPANAFRRFAIVTAFALSIVVMCLLFVKSQVSNKKKGPQS